MRILQNIRTRVSDGNERFAESSYFQNELRHSRQFQSFTLWAASTVALGLFVILRFWSTMPVYLLLMLAFAVLSVPLTWLDTIRDHKRMHGAIQTKSSDDLARQALNLAAGQAFSLSNGAFFITVVLFVLAALLVQFNGR